MLLRKVNTDRCEEGQEISPLMRVAGVFPINFANPRQYSISRWQGMIGGVARSMPSKPDASTSPRADRAKLSRRIVLDATIGNVSLD